MPDSRMQVAGGYTVDALHPSIYDIDINTIAHSLSNQCRFAGHVKEFYSVAEHSIRVSWAVPEEDALWALLHDASEAYLVDIPSPIKNDLFGKQYREVEDKLMYVICKKYNLDPKMPESVRYADNSLLHTEVRDLLTRLPDADYNDLWDPWLFADPQDYHIVKPWSPAKAKFLFLSTFQDLMITRSTLRGNHSFSTV